MKLLRICFFIILAFLLTILDVAFFPQLGFRDAGIVSTLVLVTTLSLIGNDESFLSFSFAAVESLALFSSVHMLVMLFCFFVFPYLMRFIRMKYLPKPSPWTAPLYYLLANIVFYLALIVANKAWSLA